MLSQRKSAADLQRWAALFLPCVLFGSRDKKHQLGGAEAPVLCREVAEILSGSVCAPSFQIYCLEVGVRLQPDDLEARKELGKSYDKSPRDGRNMEISKCFRMPWH